MCCALECKNPAAFYVELAETEMVDGQLMCSGNSIRKYFCDDCAAQFADVHAVAVKQS